MSDNLEPIELKFVMNSPEVMAEFQKMMGTVKNYDASIDASKKAFSQYISEQLKAINILDQNAQLTEKQAQALKRHGETLEWLAQKQKETNDPTQLALYTQQLSEIEIAIQKIADAANKNVQLMSPEEIQLANQKLDEAVLLLDKISDTHISPNFASPEELEILSNEINKAKDGFEQLETVIDFVQAKMAGMDSSTEEFQQLQDDIKAANDLLGRTPQLYDATGNSIGMMTDALKIFQNQLTAETDPGSIKILNTNIETLEQRIQQVKNVGKSGFDELGNKIEEQKEKTIGLQSELENLVNKMARLRMENKEGSEEYETLKNKAIETRTAIAATNQEITTGVKNTANLQGLINITQNIAAGYGLVSGAVGIFNANEEQSQKIIQKVTSILAVLQSLQQIQVALNTKDAATTALVTNAKNLMSVASLRLAAALGISQVAAQALMATLTLGLSLVITAVIVAFDRLAEKQKQQQELNKKVADSLIEPMVAYKKLREEWNSLGNDLDAKKRFITDNASEFNKLGISVTNVTEAENVFVRQTKQMELALQARAKAVAAMEMATEKYKVAIESQLEYERQLEVSNSGSFWEKMVNAPNVPLQEMKEANAEADKFFNKSLQYSKEAGKRFKNAGVKESSNSSTKFEYSAEIQAEEKKLKIAKARYGKADTMERTLYEKKIAYVKKDKTEFEKVTQEKALFEARILKNRDDESKRLSDKQQRDQESAAKKAQQLAEKAAEARRSLEEKVQAEINKLNNKELEGNEISQIKAKWQKLRDEANKVGASNSVKMSIDINEKKEVDIKNYEIETKEKLKYLNQQKELYAAYESFKTSIAQTEFAKRNNLNLEGFGTFSQIIDAEIKKLTDKANLTAQEAERLKALQNVKNETDTTASQNDFQKFEKAAQDTITHREQLEAIAKQYNERALQLEKISDDNLRNAKLAENELQRQRAVDSANAEAYEKANIYEQMSQNLIGITKQELTVRIASLEEYLNKVKGIINKEQEAFIKSEIDKAKSLQSFSNIGVYENSLLEEKKRLIAEINRKGKLKITDPQDASDLDAINQKLKQFVALKAQMFADKASQLAGGFHDMASAIGDSNEGLSSTLETMGDILNVASSAAGAFASFASGDIIGGITGVMKTISGIFSIGKKSRESERKAQEEIKKRQEEQLQAQLDYNATLRQRWIEEVKINDLYRSRVDNIREEATARKKALADNLKDQQNLFNKLLGMQTIVGQYTEKHGGFLGIGRKTRVVNVNASLSSLLGVGNGTSITDDLFKKLEEINAMTPLTGDAKSAYEQLKKLRDEYGSIAEANRQLEIQLKNALTGTTAQSLADSIREGLKSGKKSFADFANDIEGFLREAIMSGISAKMIEPKIQELQDALADMMGDGILSAEERAQFQAMYMAIVNQSQEYMDIINQAGINVTSTTQNANSLQGALKGASQESINILSGHTAAMKLTQFETNAILKAGFAQQLENTSQNIAIQMDIEKNTRRTADNTEKIHDVNDNIVRVADGQEKNYKALLAAGIIK